MSLSPGLLELNVPVAIRITATTAAAMIVTTTQGVRDFLVVGVVGIGLSDMVRLQMPGMKNSQRFRLVPRTLNPI
jgi:hypothetical protein